MTTPPSPQSNSEIDNFDSAIKAAPQLPDDFYALNNISEVNERVLPSVSTAASFVTHHSRAVTIHHPPYFPPISEIHVGDFPGRATRSVHTTFGRLTETLPEQVKRKVAEKKSKKSLGVIFLALCVIIYTIQSQVISSIQRSGTYNKPYFILYLNLFINAFITTPYFIRWYAHSYFSLLLLGQILYDVLLSGLWKKMSKGKKNLADVVKSYGYFYRERVRHTTGIRFRNFLVRAFFLSFGMNFPNYLWYISIGLISAAEVTAIFNTSCFFAYVFSIMLLGDKLSIVKLLAVAISLLGVSLLSFFGGSSQSDSDGIGNTDGQLMRLIGDGITLFAAIIFGLYEVLYKKYASIDEIHLERIDSSCTDFSFIFSEINGNENNPNCMLGSTSSDESLLRESSNDDDVSSASSVKSAAFTCDDIPPHPLFSDNKSMALFLANQYTGWIGLNTLLIHWIPLLPLHFTGYEQFEFPPSWIYFLELSLNSLMSFSYNALFLLTIAMTSPVFAGVGVMLTIPTTAIVDLIFNDAFFGVWRIVGTLLICIGFLFLLYEENQDTTAFEKKLQQEAGQEEDEEEDESQLDLRQQMESSTSTIAQQQQF